jgi:lysyl-tRNA synthetase class 2
VATPAGWSADQIVLGLYERLVEPATTEPTFYIDFPRSLTPFARAHPQEPRLAQKWDLVINGREIATSYSELVDAGELRKTLSAPVGVEAGVETSTVDESFLAVVDGGLPPCAGLAIGVERLAMTLTGADSIRDVIAFPPD